MRITTWAEYGVICAASHECSIRPVWVMLRRLLDEVLEGVRLSDLLETQPKVRRRVGVPVLQG
jgi:DNA-binding IscR family transcriptional regulator